MLANLKIRNKLLLALVPLGAMVLVAVAYASFEMVRADDSYTVIINADVKALRGVVVARGLCHRYHLALYQEIAETDPIANMRPMPSSMRLPSNSVRTPMKRSVTIRPGLRPFAISLATSTKEFPGLERYARRRLTAITRPRFR